MGVAAPGQGGNGLRIVPILINVLAGLSAGVAVTVLAGALWLRLQAGGEKGLYPWLVPVFWSSLAIFLAILMLNSRLRHLRPEAGLACLLVLLGALALLVDPPAGPQRVDLERPALQLKASDLTSGSGLFRRGDSVRLLIVQEVGEGSAKELQLKSFIDLRVDDLLAADGRGVENTGAAPDTIILSVPADQYEPLVKALANKKAAYLLPPNPPGRAATATRAAMATRTVAPATFALARSDILTDLAAFQPGDRLLIVVVRQRRDDAGRTVEYVAESQADATLLEVRDGQGRALTTPYRDAATVHVQLSRDKGDAAVVRFYAQIAGGSAFHLLPAP